MGCPNQHKRNTVRTMVSRDDGNTHCSCLESAKCELRNANGDWVVVPFLVRYVVVGNVQES